MRAQTSKLASRAIASLHRDLAPSSPISRIPFICSACRATLRPRPLQPPTARRNFLTTTSFQQNASPSSSTSSSAPAQPTNEPGSFYTLFPETFPAGPPPGSPFLPDLRALRREFLALQARAHPDRAPAGAAKLAAEGRSAALNDAYRTLADPLRHAHYLLARHGVDTEDEGATLEDSELLLTVMEAREQVDDAAAEEELVPLREENAQRIEASVAALDALIRAESWEDAGREAVKLRYWRNVEESIQGWERGVGGGMLHH